MRDCESYELLCDVFLQCLNFSNEVVLLLLLKKREDTLTVSISTHSGATVTSRLSEQMNNVNRFSCQESLWYCKTPDHYFLLF